MRSYSQKWQRPQAGEWQGLKPRFQKNSSETQSEKCRTKDWGWSRQGAFHGQVRGWRGQGRPEGGESTSAHGAVRRPFKSP